ncbi:hypothetical protein AOLI_G00299810 [Acnodon oligacanthus]
MAAGASAMALPGLLTHFPCPESTASSTDKKAFHFDPGPKGVLDNEVFQDIHGAEFTTSSRNFLDSEELSTCVKLLPIELSIHRRKWWPEYNTIPKPSPRSINPNFRRLFIVQTDASNVGVEEATISRRTNTQSCTQT